MDAWTQGGISRDGSDSKGGIDRSSGMGDGIEQTGRIIGKGTSDC